MQDLGFFFLLLLLFGQPSFPCMVRQIEWVHIHLSLEEVAVRAGDRVLVVVDILLIVVLKGF